MIVNRSIGSYGRFANGMFQIAAVIGQARKYGHPFGFEPWFNYDHRDRFGSKEDIDLQKYFVNPLPPINPTLNYEEIHVNWGYDELRLPPFGNWDIRGHFQSEKWFKDSIDEVRYYFRMKNEKDNSGLVAIHFRGGDYQEGKDSYHPRQEKEYYEKAMELFPEDNFIIFTDDIGGFRKMFPGVSDYADGEANYIEDFEMMKTCKSFICANSSYSLMAAILGEHPEKKIVCPSLWFGKAANGLPTHDLYPEGAIII